MNRRSFLSAFLIPASLPLLPKPGEASKSVIQATDHPYPYYVQVVDPSRCYWSNEDGIWTTDDNCNWIRVDAL